ncbi:hypothetical protein CHS0354_000351 [Potamilus streckersoni]|uniref:EGF-like domain-containing protein n=1 Tax=Potamilus streckersoni TaxID=2493646 RepID=A0AAE0W816_9BIVA|nr:hypothetical protein CHS0354_000351 [Potamilus streckersoni]
MDKSNGVILEGLPYANHTPLGITMYHPDAQPTPVLDHCKTLQCSHICVSRKDGALCICKEGFILNPDRKTCSEDAKRFQRGLIVSNATSFCIADIHAISVRGYNYTCYLNAIQISHFELDTAKRELIFANSSGLYFTSVDRFSVKHLLTVTGRISGMSHCNELVISL